MWAGEEPDAHRNKTRVLKPPGGGSSDIFGSAQEDANPRRVKKHNQSQLGSALFGDASNDQQQPQEQQQQQQQQQQQSGNGDAETPRATSKPGNDSYNRLFGPPDAPPATPNTKNYMRSNIPLCSDTTTTSPTKSTSSSNSTSSIPNGFDSGVNEVTAFRRIKRFRGASCMLRNPVTGDGVDVAPLKRSTRRCRDGNPVTGLGYADSQNGSTMQNGTSSSNSSLGEKSTSNSPTGKTPTRTRVPPGGYSSGLW